MFARVCVPMLACVCVRLGAVRLTFQGPSHRIASHRIASHRIVSHPIAPHQPQPQLRYVLCDDNVSANAVWPRLEPNSGRSSIAATMPP